jgi:hypothetical protein
VFLVLVDQALRWDEREVTEEEDLSRSWWLNPSTMHMANGRSHLAMSPMAPEFYVGTTYTSGRHELISLYEVPL